MYSVTQRAKMIKQPNNGFLNPLDMNVTCLSKELMSEKENIPGYVVGLVVDYLSRYCLHNDVTRAFEVSLLGAKLIKEDAKANSLLMKINKDLDDDCIINSCELVSYDGVVRAGMKNTVFIPDNDTIENIRVMVKRSMLFFKKYGPIIKDGFTFSNGYTKIISSGDGDFLTNDALWDFKVLSSEPNIVHTLQLLIYYFMGKNSTDEIFKDINKIGIFNPRLNKVYTYEIERLDKKAIEKIQRDVIGYKNKKTR